MGTFSSYRVRRFTKAKAIDRARRLCSNLEVEGQYKTKASAKALAAQLSKKHEVWVVESEASVWLVLKPTYK